MNTFKLLNDSDKPRERLLKYGANNLSDYELLALILNSGTKEKSVLELSLEILNFLKLENYNVTLNEIGNIKGIGKAKSSIILALLELSKRIYEDRYNKLNIINKVLKNSNDVYNYLKPEIIGIQKEIFFVIYLDNRCKLIEKKIISIGTSTESLVDIKEIFKYALKNNSYYVIIAHNHPSNSTNPSKNDVELTKKIVESGKIMNVNIIDHIILGNNNYFSFLENNLI